MADLLKPIVVDVTDGEPVVSVDISNVTTEVSYVPDIARWHPDYLGLKDIFGNYKGEDLSGLDLSKIAPKKVGGLGDYDGIFSSRTAHTLKRADCSELVRIAESAIDDDDGKIWNRLFNDASNLETVTGLENLICADGKYFYRMFGKCKKLTTISLPNFQGGEAKYGEGIRTTEEMFSGCSKLQRLDIRSFRILKDDGSSNIYNYSNMFDEVPNKCLIIVKDDATRKFIQGTMGYSNLTNIKIPSEIN